MLSNYVLEMEGLKMVINSVTKKGKEVQLCGGYTLVPYFPKIHTSTLSTPLENSEKQIVNPATEKKLILQGTSDADSRSCYAYW
jgi:hypothetical protein